MRIIKVALFFTICFIFFGFSLSQSMRPVVCEKAKPSVYVGNDGRVFYKGAFEDKNDYSNRFLPYLARIVQYFDAKGIKIVTIPIPGSGSVYLDQINREKPSEKDFVKINAAQILQNYRLMSDSLSSLGTVNIDVLAYLNRLHKEKPDLKLYFLADGHWTPESAKYIADIVGQEIMSLAIEKESLFQKKFELQISGQDKMKDGATILLIRRAYCPDFSAPEEQFFKYISVRVEENLSSQEALFGDEKSPVLLFGSSYSRFSFAEFLKHSLQSEVIDYKLGGGMAFGSMINEFSRPNFTLNGVKLIVWEFPTQSQMLDVPYALNSINSYRQIIPSLNHPGKIISSQVIYKYDQEIVFGKYSRTKKHFYLKIELLDNGLRDFSAYINYGSSQELFNFKREFGSNLNNFFVEMIDGNSLKSVRFDMPKGYTGKIQIEMYEYD